MCFNCSTCKKDFDCIRELTDEVKLYPYTHKETFITCERGTIMDIEKPNLYSLGYKHGIISTLIFQVLFLVLCTATGAINILLTIS